METLESIQEKVIKFRDDRNWKQFHTPKDLAISLSLEAAELLEVFQWSGADTRLKARKKRLLKNLRMFCCIPCLWQMLQAWM